MKFIAIAVMVTSLSAMAGHKNVVEKVLVADTVITVKKDTVRTIKCDTLFSIKETSVKTVKIDTLKITKVLKDTTYLVKQDTVKAPAKK